MSRRKPQEFKLTLHFVVDGVIDAQTRQDEMWAFAVLFRHAMGGLASDDATINKHATTASNALVRMLNRRRKMRTTEPPGGDKESER